MARKKPTKTQQLRRNVQRFVKRAESRGYMFPEEIKQEIKTASYQKLKSLQDKDYRRLLSQHATAIDPETGEIIRGWERRIEERSKKWQEEPGGEPEPTTAEEWIAKIKAQPTSWRKAIRSRDLKQRRKAEQDAINGVNTEGHIVYERLLDILKDYQGYPGCKILEAWLSARTRSLGFEKFIMSIALTRSDDELIGTSEELAQLGSDQVRSGEHIPLLNSLGELIMGGSMTVEQAKLLGRSMDESEDTG